MDKDKIFSLFLAVIAYLGVAFSYGALRSTVPPSIDDKILVPALASMMVLGVTLAWQVASYLLLKYASVSRKVVGYYVSYNRYAKEIGLFSISVKKLGATYRLEGGQYSLADYRKVGGWASSAPLAVETREGGTRVSYMYIGWNGTSPSPGSTSGYSSIQFIGDLFLRGNGLYIDDTRIDKPVSPSVSGDRAMAQINDSIYWKLDRRLLRKMGMRSAAAICRTPKVLLEKLAAMPEDKVEQWLDGID